MKIDDLLFATKTDSEDFRQILLDAGVQKVPTALLEKIQEKRKEDFERFKAFVINASVEICKITLKGRVKAARIDEILGVV